MQAHCADRSPVPGSAVLLYSGTNGNGFATVHDVVMEGDVPVIRAGTPASRQGLLSALRQLADDRLPPELIPAHILAKGIDHLVWYRPPSRQTIWVKAEALGGERSGEVPMSGLIWLVNPMTGSCSIFAYEGEDRPNSETKLHQAPVFNVWQDGRICTGSAAVPKGAAALVPQNWEMSFWMSWFTHPNTPKIVRGKGSPHAFVKDLLDGKYKVFPQAKLLPIKRTLGREFNERFTGKQQ
jgi:PRTRC genetic system protein B